ncbi:hypothetical protein AAG570_010596 [Ranatra chinensis]|uniref:Secreted protein n=1 Tax=Ranatra chinensis TaxID=642074 RepID=A0ABD0ZBB7_9HEMI
MACSNVWMLLTALIVALAVTGAYCEYACEGETLGLRCYGRANKIVIHEAKWGRMDHGRCGGPVLTNNCEMNVSNFVGAIPIHVLSNIVSRKSNNSPDSAMALEPPTVLKKVIRSLQGAYGFLLHQCEGTPMRLSCTGRANKIWIYKATWGMTDRGKCGGPVLTTNCKTDVTNMVNSLHQEVSGSALCVSNVRGQQSTSGGVPIIPCSRTPEDFLVWLEVPPYHRVVRPAMTYGSETGPIRKAQEKRFEVAETMMLRWALGKKTKRQDTEYK